MENIKPTIEEVEKVILIGVFGPDITREEASAHLDELERLTTTAGGIAVKKVLQNKTNPDSEFYIGKGKVEEIALMMTMYGAETLIFDDDLNPSQMRNIQRVTKAKIVDRSGLILDIFASRAKTAAAKTQVELAQLTYILPRLTRAWTHLSRQKGGIGTKGPGETQIETDRRLIGKRISVLKEKLLKLDLQRSIQRKRRENIIRVALVGYTNAGKSSLLNVLSKETVFAEDLLFATLDATVRRHSIEKRQILLSDTVGFIRKLPTGLIESFKSTLDEIREADLLLHVVDGSSSAIEEYISVVRKTLEEINADDKPAILVFNKVDIIKDPVRLAELKLNYPQAIFISAALEIGLNELEAEIIRYINYDYKEMTVRIPTNQYGLVSKVYQLGNVQKVKYEEEETVLTVLLNDTNRIKLEKELHLSDN